MEHETDGTTYEAGKSAHLQEHMLIENAAAERLHRHAQDMAGDTEHENDREHSDEPRRDSRQTQGFAVQKQRASEDPEPHGAEGRRPQTLRSQHQEDEADQAHGSNEW